jgi:heat shock protein HslJ
MRRIPVLLIAALAISSCATLAARDPGPLPVAASSHAGISELDGTEWRFVQVDGTAVPATVTATLRLRGGRASGKAGCNAYGARYHVAGDGAASFVRSFSTKMACLRPPGVMWVEQGVFDALQKTARVQIEDGRLVLLDAAGKSLAKLVPMTTP